MKVIWGLTIFVAVFIVVAIMTTNAIVALVVAIIVVERFNKYYERQEWEDLVRRREGWTRCETSLFRTLRFHSFVHEATD